VVRTSQNGRLESVARPHRRRDAAGSSVPALAPTSPASSSARSTNEFGGCRDEGHVAASEALRGWFQKRFSSSKFGPRGPSALRGEGATVFRWLKKGPPPPSGPDFSHVDSLAKARELLSQGKLEKLHLMPLEFGGEDIPQNVVYVPVGMADVKAGIDRDVIGRLAAEGKITSEARWSSRN